MVLYIIVGLAAVGGLLFLCALELGFGRIAKVGMILVLLGGLIGFAAHRSIFKVIVPKLSEIENREEVYPLLDELDGRLFWASFGWYVAVAGVGVTLCGCLWQTWQAKSKLFPTLFPTRRTDLETVDGLSNVQSSVDDMPSGSNA